MFVSCVLHILRAVTLIAYHSFSLMSRILKGELSNTFKVCGDLQLDISQYGTLLCFPISCGTRVHSVPDSGLRGRGMDARGRLRGLESDLSEF